MALYINKWHKVGSVQSNGNVLVSSNDRDVHRPDGTVERVKLMKSISRWEVNNGNKSYLLVRRGDKYFFINRYCYHNKSDLFSGELVTGILTASNNTKEFIECPRCEHRLTDLESASFPLRIDDDGSIWVQWSAKNRFGSCSNLGMQHSSVRLMDGIKDPQKIRAIVPK